MKTRKFVLATLLAMMVTALISCGPVDIAYRMGKDIAGGGTNIFRETYYVEFSEGNPNIFDVIAKTAKDLGYQVTDRDKRPHELAGMIHLKGSSDALTKILIGKVTKVEMMIQVTDEGRMLENHCEITGNWDTGTEKQLQIYWNSFEKRLKENIQESEAKK